LQGYQGQPSVSTPTVQPVQVSGRFLTLPLALQVAPDWPGATMPKPQRADSAHQLRAAGLPGHPSGTGHAA